MASVSVLREVCWVSAFNLVVNKKKYDSNIGCFFFSVISTQIVCALTELFMILWHVCIGQWREMGMGIH